MAHIDTLKHSPQGFVETSLAAVQAEHTAGGHDPCPASTTAITSDSCLAPILFPIRTANAMPNAKGLPHFRVEFQVFRKNRSNLSGACPDSVELC